MDPTEGTYLYVTWRQYIPGAWNNFISFAVESVSNQVLHGTEFIANQTILELLSEKIRTILEGHKESRQ